MKQTWFTYDPSAGISRDEFSGTHVYEDTGMTLAEEFPQFHFKVPIWKAWIFEITQYLHSVSCNIVCKHFVRIMD